MNDEEFNRKLDEILSQHQRTDQETEQAIQERGDKIHDISAKVAELSDRVERMTGRE